MTVTLDTFADFLADFPYEAGWLEDSTKELPGKDVSELLVNGLRKRGIDVNGVDAADYGHFIECISVGRSFTIVVSVDDPWEMKRWTVQCYPSDGLLTRLIHGYAGFEFRQVLTAVHQALKGSGKARDIRWFPDFDPPWCLDTRKAAPAPVHPTTEDKTLEVRLWDKDLDG
jgi:hypothetical protein